MLNSVLDELEDNQHGDSLFQFDFQKSGFPHRWKNVVNKQRYQATLHQKRNPTQEDDVGTEISEALVR